MLSVYPLVTAFIRYLLNALFHIGHQRALPLNHSISTQMRAEEPSVRCIPRLAVREREATTGSNPASTTSLQKEFEHVKGLGCLSFLVYTMEKERAPFLRGQRKTR
jgi:hypothetical protein